MPALTPATVRDIARVSGLPHAEFCVQQETTQIGRDAAEPLWIELMLLCGEDADEHPDTDLFAARP